GRAHAERLEDEPGADRALEDLDVHVRRRGGEPGRERGRDRDLRLVDHDPQALTGRFLLLVGCALLLPGATRAATGETHLVYTRNFGTKRSVVWIADGDGRRQHRLAAGNHGLVSPQGDVVAIDRGKNDLYLAKNDG